MSFLKSQGIFTYFAGFFYWNCLLNLFAFSFPVGTKIADRLRRAVAGGAHPRRIYLFKSVYCKKMIDTGWYRSFLELLARFELATSSLPTILEQFSPCVAYRKLLDKTLVYQGLSGFACCPLPLLAVGVLCRFFMARYGFVSVSSE